MKFFAKNKRGFTLVETLVAIAILLLGVTATFTAAQLGISSTSRLRNRLTATLLAQEALEGVRNLKDTNLLKIDNGSNINWLEGITRSGATSMCQAPNTPCGYDIRGGANGLGNLKSCDTINGCPVGIDSAGFYRQFAPQGNETFITTGFVRKIYVTETATGAEAKVRVVVSRPDHSVPDLEVDSLIYNWF